MLVLLVHVSDCCQNLALSDPGPLLAPVVLATSLLRCRNIDAQPMRRKKGIRRSAYRVSMRRNKAKVFSSLLA